MKFTEEQINSNLKDREFGIFYEQVNQEKYNVYAFTMPKGLYYIDCGDEFEATYVASHLKQWRSSLKDKTVIRLCFDGVGLFFPTLKDPSKIVASLRKQALDLEKKAYKNQEWLIPRRIEQNMEETNHGEDFNRESFYETIHDCVLDNIPLGVDKSKSLNDPDTRYIRMMANMQKKKMLYDRLYKDYQDLEELEQEETELRKF